VSYRHAMDGGERMELIEPRCAYCLLNRYEFPNSPVACTMIGGTMVCPDIECIRQAFTDLRRGHASDPANQDATSASSPPQATTGG
jgi:hypothetical protein